MIGICLKCGKLTQVNYCEECFQEVITQNLKLQEKTNEEYENKLLYSIIYIVRDLEMQVESKKCVGLETREFLRKFNNLVLNYRTKKLIEQNETHIPRIE